MYELALPQAALMPSPRRDEGTETGMKKSGSQTGKGEKIDEKALKTLVRAAVTLNKSKARS